jgi:hypothetical protein
MTKNYQKISKNPQGKKSTDLRFDPVMAPLVIWPIIGACISAFLFYLSR